ncbi:hypothetical protein MUO71_00300, partial [Candidatus Bathyarchaeota archaeon]|nr:hypothetical protein [Candidatus Bathyarchaeota archaeon]
SIKVNGNSIVLTDTGLAGTADGTLTYIPGASFGDLIIHLNVVAGNKYAINMFANDGTLIGSYTSTA